MIKKKASPKGRSVRVTFAVPASVADQSVAVVGDFNGWDDSKHVMDFDSKNGVWKKQISLKPGSRHEFRYLVDGVHWFNDDAADDYVPSGFASENCVVTV